jgi:PEP-CTERM/exosortase A-associated glycosyltransferase
MTTDRLGHSGVGYVFRSLGILAAQREFGWETVQVTGPRQNVYTGQAETVDGWTFRRTPQLPKPLRVPVARELLEMWALERRLAQVIAETRPDIVHAHSPALVGWPALRAARRARLPVVYEIRGLWEDAAVDLGHSREGDLRYRMTRALETALLRRVDAVVTLCEGMRGELVARGIPAERITVVPNAVEPALLHSPGPKEPALLESLGLTGRTVLGFIGSFYHYEGLDLLIEAIPAIREAVPDVAVLLVGGGPMAERLGGLVADRGLGDRVRFTGRVPHGDVQRYYDLVDFLVLPRKRMRLTELVTPLKPLEAMAEGRLVIASDVGGHRELIRDGVTGFLFPADDPGELARAVVETARAVDRHSGIREAARRFVETERVWPVSVAEERAVYQRLLGLG